MINARFSSQTPIRRLCIAAIVCLTLALLSGSPLTDSDILWKFAIVGMIAPGSSQGLFVSSIGSIGPARTSILIGTSPVFSVLLAESVVDTEVGRVRETAFCDVSARPTGALTMPARPIQGRQTCCCGLEGAGGTLRAP